MSLIPHLACSIPDTMMGLWTIVLKITTVMVITMLMTAPWIVHAQPDDGNSFRTEGSAAADSVGFYNLVRPPTQNSYLVELRRDPYGPSSCFGALVSSVHVLTTGCRESRYAVIASLFKNETSAQAETIKIKSYKEIKNSSIPSSQALGIYILASGSKLKPIALPDAGVVSLSTGASVSTFGWNSLDKLQLVTKRYFKTTECTDPCKNCVCALISSAQDGCDVLNGSPLISTSNGKEVLFGLHSTSNDACGKTGFPLTFTTLADQLPVVKLLIWLELLTEVVAKGNA